ncbi:MAG: sugar transferase, partial [Candidatus Kapabacteria bacterium]|nr:sugar transferase [Candidatus Kapabacteria bacterium]
YLLIRQTLEVLLILATAPITLPITLIIGIIVAFDSGFPIFYLQLRPGKNGELFKIVKFRTMKQLQEEMNKLTDDNDPRITRIGKFLRRHRLDELPQLWNVLKGEMSLIGPRPEAQFTSVVFSKEIPGWDKRLAIRPGVTGWQQVHQGHVNSTEETKVRLEYDLHYIDNISIWLDIRIVFRTFVTMFRGHNSR